jgi:RNA polymerase sigma-70 factor (ECF subfamily)
MPQCVDKERGVAQQAPRDEHTFAEIYGQHVHTIYRYHLVRTGSADDAQDLTSLTFLAAWESFQTYGGRGSLAAWLLGIARHKVADFYRQRRDQEPLDQAGSVLLSDPSLEDVAAIRQQLAQVAAALRTLPPDQAEALTLRIFGEQSAAEAGQIMGKSAGAVKMLVHRALHTLRQRLSVGTEV